MYESNLDAPVVGGAPARPVPHGERSRSDTGPAAQGLPHSSLGHPHPDHPHTVAHQRIGGDDELDVGA